MTKADYVPYDGQRLLKADKVYKFPKKDCMGKTYGWLIMFRDTPKSRFWAMEVIL